MTDKLIIDENALEKAVGGEKERPVHYCSLCGAKLDFLREQNYHFNLVYRCPNCGEVEVFRG